MSALDWGAGSGTNATPRYYTVPSPPLPNSDWCMGGWIRKSAITGSGYQFLFCLGSPSATNSIYAYLGETSFGFLVGSEAINSAGTSWINAAQSGTPAQDGLDYLLVVQRRSGNYEVYLVAEGSTVSAANLSASGVSGTFSAGTISLGYGGSSPLRNPFGEFFAFTDRSLSFAQLTTLAAGARPKTSNVGGEPLILLPFRSGDVASETNLGTGGATYDSTRVSSGFTTTTDFFTLPTNPAITSVSTMTPRQGESFTITGTNFGATQGSGYVSLGGATQYTTLSWSNTSITIVVDRTTNKYGVGVTVQVIDNSLNPSGPYALTSLLPQTGWGYIDIGTPNTTAANRITSVPDLASGDQVSYTTNGGQVVVANDGTFSVSTGVRSFDFEVWTSPDGWGGQATQYVRADVADTRLKKQRMRSSVMRWMYSGAGGEKFTQRGWFSRDIVLPISAASGTHTTTGALAAQSATIAGSATHLLLHTTTGALSAQAATISGAAQHQHAATGALAAQAATVAGSAAHLTLHATTGALSAQSSTIAGAAAHQHAATGALQAQSATIAGSADHTAAGSSHSTSGALSAQAATIAGSATHLTLHTTTGALSAQSATIAGAALHPHTTSGALQAQSATLAGTAAHATLHTTGGALSAQAATLSGAAAHEHASAGALAAQSATIAGTAVHAAAGVHIATGALQAGDASISGSAAAPIQRQVLGGWAKYRRQDRQERPDDEESTKTPQPNDTPVVEAVAPKQRIRGRIRIADIAARLAEQQQADADKLERQAVERARRKRRQQQEEELLLF